MESLLKHLVDITGQRDHALLDRSVVSALHELVVAEQVKMYELYRVREELLIRPKVWVQDGKVVSQEEPLPVEMRGESIATYPALVSAIKQRESYAEDITASGAIDLWLLIWLQDKLSICIQVINPTPYSDRTRDVVLGILSVYRNYQTILDYSERDSLTGLLNRKTFDERFSRLLAAPVAEREPERSDERRAADPAQGQWLAVIDIDHFKRVNDQFGHLYGDEVLILVANLLRASFRAQDRIFRFGGEEFVVLLRSTSLEEAHQIFERLRTNVEKHVFPQVGKVTLSLGFAAITSESPVIILGHADQALYHAKASGRNRICHYEELISSGLLRSEVSNDTVEFF